MTSYSLTNGKSTSPPPLPVSDEHSIPFTLVVLCLVALLIAIAFALVLIWSSGSAGPANAGTSAESNLAMVSDNVVNGAAGELHGSGMSGNNGDLGAVSGSPSANRDTNSQPSNIATTGSLNGNEQLNEEESANELTVEIVDAPTSVEIEGMNGVSSDDKRSANKFFTIGNPPRKGDTSPSQTDNDNKSSAAFFGVEAKGKRFVYVVDVSSSMTGRKFEKARQEVIDSINALGGNQYFFVAFFNDVPYYQQPVDRLLHARPQNKNRIKAWTMLAIPSGGTSPFEAVAYAIRLRPDSVFLLSDGEFDPSEVANINDANIDFQIPIHTIGFQTDSFTLKQIAEENNGRYRFVP